MRFIPCVQRASSQLTWERRTTVTTPRKYTTGSSTSAKATNASPKSVACETSASATTEPPSDATKIEVRLIASV